MAPKVAEEAANDPVPPQPATGWPVDTILQWFGVASLGLIMVFNVPWMSPAPENLLAWTLETWVVALAASVNVLVFGMSTHHAGVRTAGVVGSIGILLLTPGSLLVSWFFASSGGWLVLVAVLLLGTGEFVRWVDPGLRPQAEEL